MQIDPHTGTSQVSAAGLTVPASKPFALSTQAPVHLAVASRVSAAGLSVPARKMVAEPHVTPDGCRPPRTRAERNALFDRLRALRDSLPPEANKNDRAIILISACISGGIRTKRDIVGALVHLGFDNMHAAVTLDRGTGTSPAMHRWSKGSDGRYRLLE